MLVGALGSHRGVSPARSAAGATKRTPGDPVPSGSVGDVGGFRLERGADLGHQGLGHLLLALAPHHRPQLGLEVVRLGTGLAVVEVAPDGAAAFVRELPVEEAARIIKLPENEWTMTPKKVMVFADYMSRVGMIPVKPDSWKDVYINEVHNLPGS